jgi:hypothetical protein
VCFYYVVVDRGNASDPEAGKLLDENRAAATGAHDSDV